MVWSLALAGMVVGGVVGLTGMGGGALMTPMLVVFFHVEPLTAVSSDLVASLFMKPVGAAVHMRRGTVNFQLVKWLCIGSVPAAFAGVFVLRALGQGRDLQTLVGRALGVALLIAAAGLTAKTYLALRERAARRASGGPATAPTAGLPRISVKPLPTILIGAVGGLVVGMTSVGSGSLIIVALLAVYPTLRASQLVGTDLVQAVPLVAAAALGHLLFGDFQLSVTASLLVGAIPGVYLGARVSSAAPGGVVRRALVVVLVASGLKLLETPTGTTAWALTALVVGGSLGWMGLRVHHGLPALARLERPRAAAAGRKTATPPP